MLLRQGIPFRSVSCKWNRRGFNWGIFVLTVSKVTGTEVLSQVLDQLEVEFG